MLGQRSTSGGHSVSVVNTQVGKGRKQGGPAAIEGIVEGMFPWQGGRTERGPKGISSLSRNSVIESRVETPGLCAGPAQGQPTCPTADPSVWEVKSSLTA